MDGAVELISRTEDGLYRLPAFIDAHVHVESSHLTPARFGRLIAAQGTLTAVCDPHEIVNVMGEAGLDFMLADAKGSPADLRFALPSCVPATSAAGLALISPAIGSGRWDDSTCTCASMNAGRR